MLKLSLGGKSPQNLMSAAFRRLCVETFIDVKSDDLKKQPPSGGCVLKQQMNDYSGQVLSQPPSGGCVLKHVCKYAQDKYTCSRLQAAVC